MIEHDQEDAVRAWTRGFAACLRDIWRLHHDGRLVRHLRASGINDEDYKALVEATTYEVTP